MEQQLAYTQQGALCPNNLLQLAGSPQGEAVSQLQAQLTLPQSAAQAASQTLDDLRQLECSGVLNDLGAASGSTTKSADKSTQSNITTQNIPLIEKSKKGNTEKIKHTIEIAENNFEKFPEGNEISEVLYTPVLEEGVQSPLVSTISTNTSALQFQTLPPNNLQFSGFQVQGLQVIL